MSTLFLDLARRGLRVPMATDLYLHDQTDPEAARRDGGRMAALMARAAADWGSPLAMPLMDLRLEKADLLARRGMDEEQADRFQFEGPLDAAAREALGRGGAADSAGSQARAEAIRVTAGEGRLVPVGMVIGPFSLTTKLMKDPITPAAMLASGVGPDEEPQVRLLLELLALSLECVTAAVARQLDSGARAMLVCEPTANTAFLSPRMIRAGSNILERLVLEPNERLKARIEQAGADLIFHDCGELIPEMVQAFGHRLRPAVLSLGSSRVLAEDAARVPADVVLYGNLPSKLYYSDTEMPVEAVAERAQGIVAAMRGCGHPHILGTECDVLHVPESAQTIRRKVEAMRGATAGA
jgi:uroporphyrinogen-III decarboxylase